MRIAAYENFITKLLMNNKCMDINEIDKYILRTTSNNYNLVKKQRDRTNKLLEERYERYGCLTEEDNVEALKKGYYDLGKIGLTLEEIRKRIAKFQIDKESPMGIQIEKDWNFATLLLQDLLQLENMNLITYLRLLEERLSELSKNKTNKKTNNKPNNKETTIKTNSPTTTSSDIMTVDEICALLHLSKSKIYHMACAHEIPHHKLNPSKKGRLYFFRSEIEEWLRNKRIRTVDEFLLQFEN